ncbi:MAG: hypothetical protein EBU90_25540, partial [Proteobacteria bacterium]|nr:hypothetical protein [Pseudomonadota bacterium]
AGPQLPSFVASVKKEEVEVNEKIDVGADAGATISDFVHSKSKTFKGDSKKQRIKRALGAYYAAQKEETENIYNYVIETLVDADFAEDYKTAENMFECMSDEFVAVILEEYIEEAKRSRTERRAANAGKEGYDAQGNPIPKISTTHVIDDIDDNRADQRHPDAAKIDVMRKIKKKWEKVQSLTPSEFAHHKLRKSGEPVTEETNKDPGDKYGFDEFLSSKKFRDTTKPIKSVGRLGDSPRRPAKRSVVTARGGSSFGSNKPSTPMDDPGSFARDLRDRIGIRGLKRKDIHFTGGMNKGSNKSLSGPEKKGKLVSKIVKPSDKKVITTDDHLGNTRAMAAAASAAAPQAKVKAYQSRPSTKKPKGKGKVGDIVPSRVGKENKPEDTNIGIRSKPDAPKSTKQTQRARKKARKNMGEEMTSYEFWKQFVGEAAYTGGPVGKNEMIASNIEKAKQSSSASSTTPTSTTTTTRPGTTPTSTTTTTRPGTTPTSTTTTTRPGTTPKPPSSNGGILSSLDKFGRDTAGKVGETIGRNKTGNIPIISDIGGAIGRQKGTDMYDKITSPFRKEEISSYDYWKQFIN